MGALGSLLATLLRANSRNFVCRTRFSSIWAPFGYENQRNSAKNLRNHGENLRPAPRIKRRIPTRVRRSREANSIRRTRRLRREHGVLNNATRTLSKLLGSLPPLTPPPASASPPYPPLRGIVFGLCKIFFAFDPQSRLLGRSWAPFSGFNTALGCSWLVFLLKIAPKELRRAILGDLGSILSRF